MDFTTYLTHSGLIIATGLFVLGMLFKRAPFIPDWLIPFILGALGIVGACASMEGGITVENILQGIFATGMAVFVNQVIKQGTVKDVGVAYDAAHLPADEEPVEDLGFFQPPDDTEGADKQ